MRSSTSSALVISQLWLLVLFVGSVFANSTEPNSGLEPDLNIEKKGKVHYIIGGDRIVLGEFQYMAALGWKNELGDVEFLCGGMLVSPEMVLTAAHCANVRGKIPDIVLIGGHPLTNPYNEEKAVIKAIAAPEYQSYLAYHDIALLQLESSAIASPGCLWTEANLPTNDTVAIGYGQTSYLGQSSAYLLKVNLTVFPQSICQPHFRKVRKLKSGLLDTQICVGHTELQKDTCQGDSGGPLLIEHEGKKYAVGLTSVGLGCGFRIPGIYTRISSYMEWINATLSAHNSSLPTWCS